MREMEGKIFTDSGGRKALMDHSYQKVVRHHTCSP